MGVIVAAAVLVVATAVGFAWRAFGGRLRKARPAQLTASQLGQPLGTRATLLQFSSAFCAPCRATRQVLAEVAGGSPGVAHVDLDVADHLDLVRMLGIRRAPTVFVLGPEGQIAQRASGLVRRDEVAQAVARAAGQSLPATATATSPAEDLQDLDARRRKG